MKSNVEGNNIEISVIVPVYNVELYISECIKSLATQTFENFEVIIVDDGSKDSSISICESIVEKDTRFRILHKKNGGLMSAWKYGLKQASGDYICFVDSDDWIDNNMLEVLLQSIKDSDADVVFSGYVTEGGGERKYFKRDRLFVYEGEFIRTDFIKQYCNSYLKTESTPSICRWDKIYKKEILVKNLELFNEKVSMAEDFNTNIAVLLDAKKVVLLPNFTPYHYRYNPKSIVNTINPKAFHNILELGLVCNRICRLKNYDSLYVDGFIGNVIFEEVNRICRVVSYEKFCTKTLNDNLNLCNGYYYLDCYSRIRNKLRIKLYNFFIQKKLFRLVKFLNSLYKLNVLSH